MLKILNEHGSNRNLLEQLQYSLLLLPYDDCGLPTCLLINGRYTVVELHSLEITSVVTLSSTRTEWYIINNVECQKENNSFSCHFSKPFKYMTSINLQWNPTFLVVSLFRFLIPKRTLRGNHSWYFCIPIFGRIVCEFVAWYSIQKLLLISRKLFSFHFDCLLFSFSENNR